MLKAPHHLKEARVLLTNDDGIDAPGLAVLEEVLRPLVRELVVVAPERNQSGCGHTVAVAHPIRLRQVSAGRYAVDSTPPDCVLLGVREVMQAAAPDLILSGINAGRNIAEYVHYSGTCAACYEAGLMGLPSIALSQEKLNDQPLDFDAARGWLPEVLTRVLATGWPGECFINVNFPARPALQIGEVALTRLGRVLQGTGFVKGTDPRGRDYYWNDWCDDILNAVDAAPDTDLAALARGAIAITPVAIDQTDHAALMKMQKALAA
jgi:5'-nucleotidase